jgi:hypothetical protein
MGSPQAIAGAGNNDHFIFIFAVFYDGHGTSPLSKAIAYHDLRLLLSRKTGRLVIKDIMKLLAL